MPPKKARKLSKKNFPNFARSRENSVPLREAKDLALDRIFFFQRIGKRKLSKTMAVAEKG